MQSYNKKRRQMLDVLLVLLPLLQIVIITMN